MQALESKKLWGVALDVFEGEKKYIFHDKSKEGFQEHPDLAKLATFEHVILSSHIAFYTDQVCRFIWNYLKGLFTYLNRFKGIVHIFEYV